MPQYMQCMLYPHTIDADIKACLFTIMPQMLSMLGGIVGDEAVQAAMRSYSGAWAFKHPSPWDFVFFMSNELGMDLGWFWYYWLWTTESVDAAIQSARGSATAAPLPHAPTLVP